MDNFPFELVDLKERLMRAGYIAAAQALEPAVKALGWEIADRLIKRDKMEKRNAKVQTRYTDARPRRRGTGVLKAANRVRD